MLWSLSVHRAPFQAYIGSRIAEEDADAELTSYTTFADGLPLLVDCTNEVISVLCSQSTRQFNIFRLSTHCSSTHPVVGGFHNEYEGYTRTVHDFLHSSSF